MERIQVALIGAGRMGQVHGGHAARHPGLHLAYVVDARPGAAGALATATGAAVATLDAVLADPAVRGVLVCSTTDRHLEHALACVAAGKAVFCEKPIDLDLGKVLAARATFADATFLLGFNRRYDPHFAELKRRLDDGAIGRLETLQLVNHDPAAPPPGFVPTSGGLFKDFTIHDIDMARWLLDGEEIVSVYATGSCLVDPEIGKLGDIDTARCVLTTASGRLCVIANSRRSGFGYDQRIEAYCSGGMVRADNVVETSVQVWNEAGASADRFRNFFLDRYAEAYRREMDHFAEVLDGATPSVGYRDGIEALALAERARDGGG